MLDFLHHAKEVGEMCDAGDIRLGELANCTRWVMANSAGIMIPRSQL
jgi:hypothetical protein